MHGLQTRVARQYYMPLSAPGPDGPSRTRVICHPDLQKRTTSISAPFSPESQPCYHITCVENQKLRAVTSRDVQCWGCPLQQRRSIGRGPHRDVHNAVRRADTEYTRRKIGVEKTFPVAEPMWCTLPPRPAMPPSVLANASCTNKAGFS
jgi:hypothetical protein